YFLKSGHYLLRFKDLKGNIKSKSVIAPDVAAAFTSTEMDSGWLSTGIKRAGRNGAGEWFVYYRQPAKEQIILKFEKKSSTITLPIPATLLIGKGRDFYLFTMAGNEFDINATTYRAPFPNVDIDSGKICFGSNPVPGANHSNAEKVWQLFFDAPFNGDLSQNKSVTHKEDVRVLLKTLKDVDVFPVEEMIKFGTVKTTFERIIK
ncbi:MAG: prokaryotic E2 ligase family D protein, partial [Anaerolineae bacterium]|nr:prokaryotic E2 ligase family D protein [Anaerolineae bacterium]